MLIAKLCSHFGGLGYRLVLFHFGHEQLAQRAAALGVETVVLPHEALYKSVRTLPKFARSFAAELRRREVSLLHSHLFGPIAAGAAAARLAGIPHVGTLHDTFIVEERPSRMFLLEAAAALGSPLVAVSRTMERYYRRRGCLARLRLQTIYNGVQITGRAAAERRAQVRASYGIQDEEVLFVSTGRLVSLKRFDLALRALARVANELPCKLIIAGEGPEEERLRHLREELAVADKVILPGFQHDVAGLLAAADCFVLASDTEGLSTSLLEAMAAGLPLLATDVGGNCELVVPGKNGLLVPRGDEAALAAGMRALAASPEMRAQGGAFSLARAEERFSTSSMCIAYQELYNVFLN